ncbi:MAG TPA: hypothetical protein DHW11_06100 [Gemmatimonadetes bacterium]|nr:hypothetical protein [Gemmatimonadota bacterium]
MNKALAFLVLPVFISGCRLFAVAADQPAPFIEVGVDSTTVVANSSEPAQFVAPDPVRTFDEVRALWVVRFTMTSKEAILGMIVEAERSGINTLVIQVRGRADAFYKSSLEPRGESVREPASFDPLEFAIGEAHDRGIAVHAWVNTHLVWGPAQLPQSPDHIVNAHPEWLSVPRELGRELATVDPFESRFVDQLIQYAEENSSTVEGVYTSPSHPAVQDHVHAIWMDLARRYDLDGIHFDYIRFPSDRYDYSIGAIERFRVWLRGQLTDERWGKLNQAYESDLYAFVDGEAELWNQFRRGHITHLVERIYRDVKAFNPHLTISAAVIADTELALNDRFQAWPEWLEQGIIDIAVPMAYTRDPERFRELVGTARSAVKVRHRVWAGIGAYMNTVEATIGMIDIARSEEVGGVVLFSYDWLVGEGMSDPTRPFLGRIAEARFDP